MVTSFSERESRRVQELAREYERRGFKVEIEPSRKSLPEFFGAYIPDLIAHRGNEHIVIEVKSRATLSSSKQLAAVAEKLKEHTGWRLELVVTNPTISKEEDRPSLDSNSAKRRLAEAKELLSDGRLDAAILLGWSAAEATLRLKARIEGVPLKDAQPRYLVKLLFSTGLLNKRDFQALDRIFVARSHIAHGFTAPNLPQRTVRTFLDAVSRLIGSIE
jgi:REase_AHJR-like